MANKKLLLALHPGMRDEMDKIALVERRTRSELFREACRRYIADYKRSGNIALEDIVLPEPKLNAAGVPFRPRDSYDIAMERLNQQEQRELAERMVSQDWLAEPEVLEPTS